MAELVSVIITTYMRPPKIVFRAIDSVIRQTYPLIEIIVVDDSPSTCEYREILKNQIEQCGKKIKYIQHEQNMGACVARNTGVSASSGDFVAFLDDDDEWFSEKIEEQMTRFQDEQIGLVYCGKVIVDDSTGAISNDALEYQTGYVYEKLIYNNFIGSTSFPLIRRSALMAAGQFDPLMQSAQDYDLWLRISQHYKVDYVNLPLVKYHIHSGERISTNHKARISGQERLIQKNIDYLLKTPKAWWWRYLRLSLQYGYDMQFGKALRIWFLGATRQPFRIITNFNYLIRIVYYYLKGKGHQK